MYPRTLRFLRAARTHLTAARYVLLAALSTGIARHAVLLTLQTDNLEWSLPAALLRDLMQHGCRIRASMDGFTACPAMVGRQGPRSKLDRSLLASSRAI